MEEMHRIKQDAIPKSLSSKKNHLILKPANPC